MSGFTSTALSDKGQTECVNYLFPRWTLDSAWKLSIACLFTVFFAILVQGVVRLRADIVKGKYRSLFIASFPCTYLYPLTLLLLFSLQIFVGYLLMLVVMSYNAELFCSVCVGLILGHAIFNQELYWPRDGSGFAHVELEKQGKEVTDESKNCESIVDAHDVTISDINPPSTTKEADEPYLGV